MINYTLQCEQQHRFESSFNNIAAYEKLEKLRALECPCCGSSRITRAPMAPAIAKTGRIAESAAAPEAGVDTQTITQELREKFADVGDAFPEEARALFHGDKAAKRRYRGKFGIMGNASEPEAKAMAEEGLPVARVRVPKFDA